MQAQWHFLGKSAAFRERVPARVVAGEMPLVLTRFGGALRAFVDRCPHRGFALSRACASHAGEPLLRCPYHGWAFNEEGRLVERPGIVEDQAPELQLQRYAVAEAGGFVFAHPEARASAPAWILALGEKRMRSISVVSDLRASTLHVMENLLDPFHTHYVHGLMLRTQKKRHLVDLLATYREGEQSLTMEYFNEPKPAGLVSKLFERERTRTLGRYHHANVGVLEYWGPSAPDLRVTMNVSDLGNNRTRGVIVFQVGFGPLAFFLTWPLLTLLARILVNQDKLALEKLQHNNSAFPGLGSWQGEEDIVMNTMRALKDGKVPASFEKRLSLKL